MCIYIYIYIYMKAFHTQKPMAFAVPGFFVVVPWLFIALFGIERSYPWLFLVFFLCNFVAVLLGFFLHVLAPESLLTCAGG